jgi:hypothetical protein
MSLSNASVVPLPDGMVEVTFTLKHGADRVYVYSGDAAAKILAGADPALFYGERVS